MTAPLVAFALGAIGWVGGVVAWRRAEPRWRGLPELLLVLALGLWASLLQAPFAVTAWAVAGLGLVVGSRFESGQVGRSHDTTPGGDRPDRTRWWRRYPAALLVAPAALVLWFAASAMARQFVTPGADIDASVAFGDARAFVSAADERHRLAVALVVIGGVALMALAPVRGREAE
ncbi:MAG: hypothetical protein B7733_12090 [Myxococcales bacterium FL481]|nr:MAG: hypothetical protein B7733_12090 [Myxococcales bacterium FL481]